MTPMHHARGWDNSNPPPVWAACCTDSIF